MSKWCRRPQGPLIKVYGVCIDAYCHGGFNETIGGRVRHRRPDISPPFHGGGHISPYLRHHMRLFTLTPTCGGKGGDLNLPSSHGGGPLQPQLRHQNRLFSANAKEGGQGAAGERVKKTIEFINHSGLCLYQGLCPIAYSCTLPL